MWIFEDRRKRRARTPGKRSVSTCAATVVCSLLLSAACLLPPAYCLPVHGLYEIQEIKPGVFILIPEDVTDPDGEPQFSRRANAGFVVTDEGAVVVNTMNTPFRARELLYEIRRRTDLPVRYVINTDAHPDVVLGNEAFMAEKSAIIATTPAAAEMREYARDLRRRLAWDENWRLQARMRGIHPTPPTQTFDTELRIKLGGEEIRAVRLSGGHSNGDAVVHLGQQRVVFLGHLFESGFFPRLDQSDVRRWIEILRELESWDVDLYVPAHGPPGGKKELAEFRRYLEWLSNEIATRVAEGKSMGEVKRELKLTETYRWSARELASRAVEEIYQQSFKNGNETAPQNREPAGLPPSND